MRRRGPRVEQPPEQLLRFDPGYWSDVAPAWDPRVDEGVRFNPSQSPEQRAFMRALYVWKDARSAWRDAHGWPSDGIDFLRQERAARLSHMYPDRPNRQES